jgi:hypothetical protein
MLSLALHAAAIAAKPAFIGNAPRLAAYGSSKARSMPFGLSFGITSHEPQTDPAFASGVEWPTPNDDSGQSRKPWRAAALFWKSATAPHSIPQTDHRIRHKATGGSVQTVTSNLPQ